MPVLSRNTVLDRRPGLFSSPTPLSENRTGQPGPVTRRFGLLEACSNPACRSGWLHLWRSRSTPVIEGGWTCSSACTAERLRIIVSREMEGRGAPTERHRHRVPLGLLMMEQGWINASQLRSALQGQKEHGAGRLGQWLIAREGISEHLVTRALGLQWSCPVLPLESHDPMGLAPLVPRLFLDAFRALPLRVAAGKLLYLGFEDRLDPVLALAVERVSGLRVESGLVQGSLFQPAHTRMLQTAFPSVELLEAVSQPAMVRALSRRVEQFRPAELRLVRVHELIWMRMWNRPPSSPIPEPSSVQDVICTFSPT